MREMAFSSRLVASSLSISADAQPHGDLLFVAVFHGKHAVLIAGEGSELIDIVPHTFVRSVEKVGSVFVDFDAGFGLGFRIGIAADVAPTFDDEDALPEL